MDGCTDGVSGAASLDPVARLDDVGEAQATPPAIAPIDCEMAVRRLWDYLDGRLPAVSREEVEAHLASCALCAPHFTFAREMQTALAAAAPAANDADAPLRARVRDALRRHVTTNLAADPGDTDEW